MQYQGGKSRIAKSISEVVNEVSRWQSTNSETYSESNNRHGGVFVSLFCGACSVESILAPHFDRVICNDTHEYLIELLKGIQHGYELPDVVTEEDYRYIKQHKDEDKTLAGFVGFACSFGGRWFQGYARDKQHDNYALRGKKSIMSKMKTLMDAEFICMDYRDVELPDGCVIYADPPYNNTKKFTTGNFDTESFWEYMREISRNHLVFISELEAPDDFVCIWQREITRTLDRNKSNQFKSTEKLFIHKCNEEYYVRAKEKSKSNS